MSETFHRYDSAEHLKTDEDIVLYIEAALEAAQEEADPALLMKALGIVARARNMSQLAKQANISREGLYKALSGQGNPSFATAFKVMAALDLRLTVASAPGIMA